MKKHYNIKAIYLFIAFMTLLASCSKMNDLHDEYLQHGETVYVGKPDSVFAFAGRDRVKITYWVSDPKATKLVIYWLSRTDSLLVDIPPHLTKDSVEIVISGLPEYAYSFELITMNSKHENRSLPILVNGNSYGDNFQSFLLNRVVKDAKQSSKTGMEITWLNRVENGVANELKYLNTEGDYVVKLIPMSEDVTEIADVDWSGDVEYRTLFLPEEFAIDTFYTDYETMDVERPTELIIMMDKPYKRWNPDAIPYMDANSTYYAIERMWDDITTSSNWFIQNTLTVPVTPHSFTFDLGKEVVLKRFKQWQRLDLTSAYRTRNVSKFELWGSATPDVTDDFSDWVRLGEYEVTRPSGEISGPLSPTNIAGSDDMLAAAAGHDFDIALNVPVRYIRYVIIDTFDHQHQATIGELTFWETWE